MMTSSWSTQKMARKGLRADYGTSPEPQDGNQEGGQRIDSDKTSGDKDVEMETEPTPRKRKLAECADGILSTDDCPVCHANDHKLVDCQNPEAKTMVRLLKGIAEGEKKIPSGDSKKASSSSASGGGLKEEKPTKQGKGPKMQDRRPSGGRDRRPLPNPSMSQRRQNPVMMKELVNSSIGGHDSLPSHKADAEFMQKVRKDGNSMYYSHCDRGNRGVLEALRIASGSC